jgi:hypothetical protein
MECVIGPYKTERIRTTVFHTGPYRTIGDVEYTSRRLGRLVHQPAPAQHSGMMAPVEFELAHYVALNREPPPVLERRRTWGASVGNHSSHCT